MAMAMAYKSVKDEEEAKTQGVNLAVVALNRSFKSQLAARYTAFWHADPQIALTSFL